MIAVYELPSAHLAIAEPMFAGAWFDRAQIQSVFEGRQEGRVFVDDAEHPTAALLCRTYEYYVVGDPEARALRRFIADAPAEPGVFQDLYGYCPVGEAWRNALLADQAVPLEVIDRRSFRYGRRPHERWPDEWRNRLPPGMRIVPIDHDLAARIDEEMHQFIGRFWGGYDRFAAHGFGYCTLVADEPVSVAYTISVGAGEANIDVETAERFRRRGLSTITSAAYIDHCHEIGLIPTWDCDADNAASIATARRLGFSEGQPFWEIAPYGRGRLPLCVDIWRRDLDGSTGSIRWSRPEYQ